jgi:hypothetical protein
LQPEEAQEEPCAPKGLIAHYYAKKHFSPQEAKNKFSLHPADRHIDTVIPPRFKALF